MPKKKTIAMILAGGQGTRLGALTKNLAKPAVPFGGLKMSGYGKESGVHHVDEYLSVKAVWIKTQ